MHIRPNRFLGDLQGKKLHFRYCMIFHISCNRSMLPSLNNRKLYIMGVYEYLEFGLFIFDPQAPIIYKVGLFLMGICPFFNLKWRLYIIQAHFFQIIYNPNLFSGLFKIRIRLYIIRIHFWPIIYNLDFFQDYLKYDSRNYMLNPATIRFVMSQFQELRVPILASHLSKGFSHPLNAFQTLCTGKKFCHNAS